MYLYIYIANFLSFSTFFSWRSFPSFLSSDYPEITQVNDKVKKKNLWLNIMKSFIIFPSQSGKCAFKPVHHWLFSSDTYIKLYFTYKALKPLAVSNSSDLQDF